MNGVSELRERKWVDFRPVFAGFLYQIALAKGTWFAILWGYKCNAK